MPVHIIQRGNNRTACFYADEDYALYLAHLLEPAAKFERACTPILLDPRASPGGSVKLRISAAA